MDDEDEDGGGRKSHGSTRTADDYVEALNEVESDLAHSFDKTLTTLAAGAFALSVTFVKEIAPHPVANGWLIAAWISFAGSLIAILIGYLIAQFAVSRQANLWLDGTAWEVVCRSRVRWNLLIRCINVLSLMLFTIGIVTLTIFAGNNFRLPDNLPRAAKPAIRTSSSQP